MKCFKCKTNLKCVQTLIKHFRQAHNLGINETVQCYEENCFHFFQNMQSFRKHVIKKHYMLLETKNTFDSTVNDNTIINPLLNTNENFLSLTEDLNETYNNEIPQLENALTSSIINSFEEDMQTSTGASTSNRASNLGTTDEFSYSECVKFLQNSSINFVLKLHSHDNFTRKNVIDIQDLVVEFITRPIAEKLKEFLKNKSGSDDFNYVFKCLMDTIDNPFSENNTEYLFNNSLISKNLLSPVTLFTVDNSISEININGDAVYGEDVTQGVLLPLKFQFQNYFEKNDNLEKMLDFIEDVSNDHHISDDDNILKNYINGESWKEKKKQFEGKTIIPYFIHSDAFEINNPLGANANTHNIINVYYSFPCSDNSKLENIFLAATIKSIDLKSFGTEPCLKHLVSVLIDLEMNGLKVKTRDESIDVHFILALILGDNPGLNEFLDFNSSFSSNYFCRFCTESKVVTKYQCIQNDSRLRNIQNYEEDALALEPLLTGIKKNSIFNTIPSFHVAKNYAADLMHDWFEGICSYVLCHVIKHYIDKKNFTLEVLNSRKQCFNYGSIEISHISKPIKPKHLANSHLKMSARQMITFVHYFTLIIGDLINENDEVWLLYLNLLSINDILLSYSIPHENIAILKQKIFELNSEYIRLFNDSLKPKFHILIHYPKIIEMSGPPRHYWSMGFEEKHRDFKIYSHIMNSRKNICLTVARKYQFKFASFLNETNKASELIFKEKNKVISEFTDLVNQTLNIPSHLIEYYSKISYRGYVYKMDFYLSKFREQIHIYKIKQILIIRNMNKITIKVLCQALSDVKYEKHYASYSVNPSNLLSLSIENIDEFDGPPMNLNITHSGMHMLRLKDYYK